MVSDWLILTVMVGDWLILTVVVGDSRLLRLQVFRLIMMNASLESHNNREYHVQVLIGYPKGYKRWPSP
jgi:hypothetical protein